MQPDSTPREVLTLINLQAVSNKTPWYIAYFICLLLIFSGLLGFFSFRQTALLVVALSASLILPFLVLLNYVLSNRRLSKIRLELLTEQGEEINRLRQERNLLQSIVQSIQEGMIITDLAGNITYVNKKIAKIFQVESYTLKNKPLNKVFGHPDLFGKMLANSHVDVTNILGKKLNLLVSNFPLLTDGVIQGTIYIIHDVTGEEELERMKLDFVAQAVHQLRTPLTILKGYLSTVSENLAHKLTAEEKLYLERSLSGADQLGSLIENLLNVSKIENHQLALQKRSCQVNQLVEEAIAKNAATAKNKQVRVFFARAKEELPAVNADPELIIEVINNLIANAVENSSQGGEVLVKAELEGKNVLISVNDKGKGISSQSIKKLFTKFYKVSQDLIQETKGIGLGLYNAKAIVEAHGGRIWVDSILGKGSTFFFTIPLS